MMNYALFPYDDDDYKESGLIEDVPQTPKELKQAAESWAVTPKILKALEALLKFGAKIEFLNLSRTKGKGYPKCEVAIALPDGSRGFYVLKQIVLKGDQYGVLIFGGGLLPPKIINGGEKKRNRYIAELYKEEKVTQVFLAHLFNLSQSRISKILKKQGVKHPKR